MRVLEIRRHSLREDGPHLSDAGRELAAATRSTMAPAYALVLSSDKPRAIETAEAMGFTVDITDRGFGTFDVNQVGDYAVAFHQPLRRSILQQHATQFLDTLRGHTASLPDGARALLISHGGAIEQVAAQFAYEFSLEAIGGPFAPCEGFSLHLRADGRVAALDLHRRVGT